MITLNKEKAQEIVSLNVTFLSIQDLDLMLEGLKEVTCSKSCCKCSGNTGCSCKS